MSARALRVLIAGGGVAALEATLALSDLAGELVETTVLARDAELVYRPLAVREPFSYGAAQRYPIAPIVAGAGARLHVGELARVDRVARVVHTRSGDAIPYDALLVALGARAVPRYTHALTLDAARMDETLRGLIQDVEAGYLKSIAFVSPARMGWPLPLYELALMSAARAFDASVSLAITLITPEDKPLAAFGGAVSRAVRALLDDGGIEFVPSAYVEIPAAGEITIRPGDRSVRAQRVIALPELYGPSVHGLPLGERGFLPTNLFARIPDCGPVFAAGDATEFPVKHGGVASQQADVAAESIATLAGAELKPQRFRPRIEGVLLTGGEPLQISAKLAGGHGSGAEVRACDPASFTKIAARHLAPVLAACDRDALSRRSARADCPPRTPACRASR